MKIFFSCSLGGGGRYFSVPRRSDFRRQPPTGEVTSRILGFSDLFQKTPFLRIWCCDGNRHIQESPHPRAPKPPKSLKKAFPGLPARSVKKVSKKSPNTNFVVFLTHFQVIWDFFDTFLTLRGGRPGNTFLRLFRGFGARGCGDSCIWRFPSQIWCEEHRFTKPTGLENPRFQES